MDLDDSKIRLLGMFCASLDGRDPRQYILEMAGEECVWGHNILKQLDDLLKAQWVLAGAPDEEEIL